jgi:hypothetical protein
MNAGRSGVTWPRWESLMGWRPSAGAPRGVPAALETANQFLAPGGRITNACGSSPCYAGGYTGP